MTVLAAIIMLAPTAYTGGTDAANSVDARAATQRRDVRDLRDVRGTARVQAENYLAVAHNGDRRWHGQRDASPIDRLPERAPSGLAANPRIGQPAFYSARCADAYQAVRWYRARYNQHRQVMRQSLAPRVETGMNCARLRERAAYWQHAAKVNRAAALEHRHYHYAWWDWMPAKWQRVGACETGYGKRPGRWDWNSGTYQGAFGFYHGSWDSFVPRADPKAGPYPREAYLATPRQQYEVALAIYRRYGFSGWGCRGA